MSPAPRILLVLTSADHMGTPPEPTGVWLEEFTAPYYAFVDAGCAVTLASPEGGPCPLDPTSREETHQTASTRRFLADDAAQAALAHTQLLETLTMEDFDAIYCAGGHGTMEDFPHSADLRNLLETAYAAEKPIASVCHGPAALVPALKPNGDPMVRGHHFTCFSQIEEEAVGATARIPFPLEHTLTALGGTPSIAAPFAAHVVVDGLLLTGQNPASSAPLAQALLAELAAHRDTDHAHALNA